MNTICKSSYVFSSENEVVAKSKSGEILKFVTIDCFGGQIKDESQLMHELDLNNTNPSSGPVYIEDAKPGDVIVVDILDIEVAEAGWVCSITGCGALADRSEARTKKVPIVNGYAQYNDISWKVEPMIGVIGTAPKDGQISTGYAGNHGGNMDSKIIKKGAKVYLPVRVEGGLLQIGDLHASMGDGELTGTGIEIAGEVTVKVSLIKNFELNWPVTETAEQWFVNSSDVDYDGALVEGMRELSRLMLPVYNWDMTDIFMYLSLQGDVNINQGVGPEEDDPFMTMRIGIPKVAGKGPLIK